MVQEVQVDQYGGEYLAIVTSLAKLSFPSSATHLMGEHAFVTVYESPFSSKGTEAGCWRDDRTALEGIVV
jgi:hypothetical protein